MEIAIETLAWSDYCKWRLLGGEVFDHMTEVDQFLQFHVTLMSDNLSPASFSGLYGVHAVCCKLNLLPSKFASEQPMSRPMSLWSLILFASYGGLQPFAVVLVKITT